LRKEPNSQFLFVFHRKFYASEYNLAIKKIKETFQRYKKNYRIIESIVDVPSLIKSVDIVVLPQTSHHGTLVYPQTLLEAMAGGKTVVISRSRVIEEVVDDGKNGVLFTNGDSKDLVRAISQALKSGDTFGKKAQKDVYDKHNIQNRVTDIENLYKKII
jgi:glycosyltransferase involved in cell wall biosynthesis